MSDLLGVSVDDLVTLLKRRGGRLPFEIGAFVALEACERLLEGPAVISPGDVRVAEDGTVSVFAPPNSATVEQSARSLVTLLAHLLVAAGPDVPSPLLRLVERGPEGGRWELRRLRDDLEASLVPLNRAASRRVLSRFLRETKRDAPARPAGRASGDSMLDADLDALIGGSPGPTGGPRAPSTAPGGSKSAEMQTADLDALLGGLGPAPAPRIQYAAAVDSDETTLPDTMPDPGLAAGLASRPLIDDSASLDAPTMARERTFGPPIADAPPVRSSRPGLDPPPAAPPPRRPTPPPGEVMAAKRPTPPPGEVAPVKRATPTPGAVAPAKKKSRPDATPAPAAAKAKKAKRPAPASDPDAENATMGVPPSAIDPALLDDLPEPKRRGVVLWVFLFLVAAGLFAGGLYYVRPDIFGAAPPPVDRDLEAEARQRTAEQLRLEQAHRARFGDLIVRATPERAQILLFIGRGPALAKNLPLGVAHEFVAIADGRAPSRALVPPDAEWETTPEGRQFELAMQTPADEVALEDLDLGRTLMPQAVGAPAESLGTVRIVTSPRGAKVYQLVGFAPDAVIEDVRTDEAIEVLVFLEGHRLERVVVGPSDWTTEGDERSAEVTVTLQPRPRGR